MRKSKIELSFALRALIMELSTASNDEKSCKCKRLEKWRDFNALMDNHILKEFHDAMKAHSALAHINAHGNLKHANKGFSNGFHQDKRRGARSLLKTLSTMEHTAVIDH